MKVIFTPEDGIEQTWDFHINDMLMTELEAVEKVTDLSLHEFAEGLRNGRVTAYRALVWVMRRRNGEPELRYRDVDFPLGALRLKFEQPEPTDDDEDDEESGPKEEAPQSGAESG